MKIHQPIAGFCLAALLSACGGGSTSGETAAAPTPSSPFVSTGIFVDSPVSGIGYSTATQSGKTNAKGEFSYVAGENITFSIGSLQLPAVLANATITPLDIAKTTDVNNQVVSNILVLLQSLDEDGNPANGISIPAAAAAKTTSGIIFDVSPGAFSANTAVISLVANSGSVNTTLIAEATARAHFQGTLSGTTGTTKINVAPVANPGAVQSLVAGALATLDASASSDANNDTLTYLWVLTSKPSGSTAALSAPTSAKPTFTADVAGAYVATLVVNDGTVGSTASTVTITASAANTAPVANAGAAQSVLVKSTVSLNGAASSDANGDALTYAWTLSSKPPGSTAALANSTSVNPTFLPDVAGSYVASLVVNDGKLSSTASTITVTAAVANVAPVANAGVAQNVVAGNAVTLDGSASSDANGDALTYAWTLTSKPAGSAAVLAASTSAKPTLTADVAGTYVATLVVNDGKLNSAATVVAVTATNVIAPLSLGAGTFAQEFPFGRFYGLSETSGLLTAQASACQGYSAADVKSDGRVVAVSINSSVVSEIDMATGACRDLFALPEPMSAIAVASDGSVVTVSNATSFGARQLYRFTATGAQLGKVLVSGASNTTGISDLKSPDAIDFAPNGILYATSVGSIWSLDPQTGVGTLRAIGLAGSGDIDIDSAGTLRTIDFGTLKLISTATWRVIGSTILERDIFGFSPLVRR